MSNSKSIHLMGRSGVDTSPTTATAFDVLMGKVFVDAAGNTVTGNITVHDIAAINEWYTDPNNYIRAMEGDSAFIVPAGYYSEDVEYPVGAVDLEDLTQATATPAAIRPNNTAWVNGELIEGTMTEKLGTRVISYNGSTILPAGVSGTWVFNAYTEKIKVVTQPLSEQTVGDATASDIALNKTAWVNGEQITGSLDLTMDNAALAANTPGTAVANEIYGGKTAWVNGEQLTGTMTVYSKYGTDLTSDSNGGKVLAGTQRKWTVNGYVYRLIVNGAPLSEQTQATALPTDITEGKTAWVNGELITGTYADGLDLATVTVGTAVAGDILADKTAWVNGEQVTGTIPTVTDYNASTGGTTFLLPLGTVKIMASGYYPKTWKFQVPTLKSATSSATVDETVMMEGETAYANGALITGTIPYYGYYYTSNTHGIQPSPEEIAEIFGSESPSNPPPDPDTPTDPPENPPEDPPPNDVVTVSATDTSTSSTRLELLAVNKRTVLVDTDNLFNMTPGSKLQLPAGYYAGITIWGSGGQSELDASISTYYSLLLESEENGCFYIDCSIIYVDNTKGTSYDITITPKLKATDPYIITIPSGKYFGKVEIEMQPLEWFTVGTALASDIAKGKTAWVDGVKITGTGNQAYELNTDDDVLIDSALDYSADGFSESDATVTNKSLFPVGADAAYKYIVLGITIYGVGDIPMYSVDVTVDRTGINSVYDGMVIPLIDLSDPTKHVLFRLRIESYMLCYNCSGTASMNGSYRTRVIRKFMYGSTD